MLALQIEPQNLNLFAAWVGILAGLLSGIPLGLAFHNENWLGGYQSWTRRLLRLGHISFFGIAFLNFAFVASVAYLGIAWSELVWPSRLFVIAQVSMPTVCIAAAFSKNLRHLFFIPVGSVLSATSLFLVRGFLS